MIELYTHATPIGHKVSILLEDLVKSEQMSPAFVDPEGPAGGRRELLARPTVQRGLANPRRE